MKQTLLGLHVPPSIFFCDKLEALSYRNDSIPLCYVQQDSHSLVIVQILQTNVNYYTQNYKKMMVLVDYHGCKVRIFYGRLLQSPQMTQI